MKRVRKILQLCIQREYFLTAVFFIVALAVCAIPDCIYHYTDLWMMGKPLGRLCSFMRKLGFSYTEALKTLKGNFGIYVTAVSVVITMSVNNLNRSENKFFGLTREQFRFSKRKSGFRHGRRMLLLSPFMMVCASAFNYCITGYAIMLFGYLFLLLTYYWFESSFSKEKNLDIIIEKILESVPQTIRSTEDIADYLMLLNTMRQWNEKEKDWEDARYLFQELCKRAREYDANRACIFCRCFYETMYVQKDEKDYYRAVYALRDYVAIRDKGGWSQVDHLVLWSMMHCLFSRCDGNDVERFIKWYMNFPARSREMLSAQKLEYTHGMDMEITRVQTGILMIEMELYFHSHKKIGMYITEKLPQMWSEGKNILDERERTFRKLYLDVNAIYDLDTDTIERRMNNLCCDYQYNTTKSLLVNYLIYI